MKPRLLLSLLAAAIMTTQVATAAELNSQQDKISYAIGVDLASKFQQQNIELNPDVLIQGFKDRQQGAALQLNDAQIKQAFTDFQKSLLEKRAANFKKYAANQVKVGNDYISKYSKESGVKSTASGIQYKVIKAGKGNNPKLNDSVTVEYTGKLINGKVFDSTSKRGRPATFTLKQVIPGWQEALQMMRPGDVWEVVIPSKLAYGEHGAGNMIGPNETLIFEIHLLSINKQN